MDFVQGIEPKGLTYENAVIVETRRDYVLLNSVPGNIKSYELPLSIFQSNGLEYGLEFLKPGTMVTLIKDPNGDLRAELKGIELYSGDIIPEQEGLLKVKLTIRGGQECFISRIPTSHVVGYQNYTSVRKVKVYILNGADYKFVAIPPENYPNQLFRGEETPGYQPEHMPPYQNISTPNNQLNPYNQFMTSSNTFQNIRAPTPRNIQTPRSLETYDASNLEEIIEYSSSLIKQFSKLIELQIKSKQSFNSGQPFNIDQLHKAVKKFSELTSQFQLPYSNKIQNITKKHKKLADRLASDEAKVYLFNICQICKVNISNITLGCGHSICNIDLSNHIMNTYTIQRLPEEKYLLIARCNLCDYNLTETELSRVLDRRQFGAMMETLNLYKMNEQRFIAENKSYCGICYQLKYNQEFGYMKSCNCRVCRNCFMNNMSGNCMMCNIPNHIQVYKEYHGNTSFFRQPGHEPPSSTQSVHLLQFTSDIRSDTQTDKLSEQGYHQQPIIQPTPVQPQLNAAKPSNKSDSILEQQSTIAQPDISKPFQPLPALPLKFNPAPAKSVMNKSDIEDSSPSPFNLLNLFSSSKPEVVKDPKVQNIYTSDSKGSSMPKPSSKPLKVPASKSGFPSPPKPINNPFQYIPQIHIKQDVNPIQLSTIQPYTPSYSYIPREEKKINCTICGEDFKLSEILSLYNCEHKFCKEDLRRYTLASIESDQITKDGLKCPDVECKNMIEDHIMENLFKNNDQEWTLYNKKVMSKRLKITYCPKCNAPIEYVNRIATCFLDGYQFCVLCNEECHEGICDKNSLIQRTKEMMKVDKVAQCPGCMIPYFKDSDNCDHVKCINDSCGVDFCFDCACVRSPTLEHGNHYHRPQCKWYRPSPQPDQYLPNRCSECKKLGQLCPRPKDLETKAILTGL